MMAPKSASDSGFRSCCSLCRSMGGLDVVFMCMQ